MILSVVALVCLFYFVFLMGYAGPGVTFSYLWLGLAILAGGLRYFMVSGRFAQFRRRLPLAGTVFFWTTIALAILVVFLVEIPILRGMFRSYENVKPDILLVLGSSLKEEEPSKTLQLRLDKAVSLLEEDETLSVIVSGGTGKEGSLTEAYAMTRYLISKGIASERILVEPSSMNTLENLAFSMVHVAPGTTVGIISNSFHMFRALRLAEGLGISAVGIPAPSDKLMLPSQMLREFFAVVHEYFLGNL